MGPIEGTRVVDWSRYGPGRYCSMILADFGAEVIIVETPPGASQLYALMTDDVGPKGSPPMEVPFEIGDLAGFTFTPLQVSRLARIDP